MKFRITVGAAAFTWLIALQGCQMCPDGETWHSEYTYHYGYNSVNGKFEYHYGPEGECR